MIMRTPGLILRPFENSGRYHQILILGVGAGAEEHLVDVRPDYFADRLRIFHLMRARHHRFQLRDVDLDIPLVDGIRIGKHRAIPAGSCKRPSRYSAVFSSGGTNAHLTPISIARLVMVMRSETLKPETDPP